LCCAAGQLARRCEATSGVCFLVLEVDDMTVEKVRKIARTLTKPGQWAPLTVEDKARAAVLCPCWEARDPLVVSVGHLLSLRTAATLTAAVCREEVAEPVRQADLLGRDAVKSYLAGEPLADMRILGARAKRKGMESSVLPVIQDLLAIQAAERLGEGWKPVESRRQRQQTKRRARWIPVRSWCDSCQHAASSDAQATTTHHCFQWNDEIREVSVGDAST